MYWKVSVKGETMKESSNVKGPWKRSNLTLFEMISNCTIQGLHGTYLPVFNRMIRGTVWRVGSYTTVERAVERSEKMLPEDMKGAQVWHQL